jgi:hypothetical protein
MSDPKPPISGWTQPDAPPADWPSWLERPPSRRSDGRGLLWGLLGGWAILAFLSVNAVLFLEGMQGDPSGSSELFRQVVTVGALGFVGLALALWLTYRRARPG